MKLAETYRGILNRQERRRIRNQLREIFGVSQTTISNWLSGRTTPPEDTRHTIASIFGKEVRELF